MEVWTAGIAAAGVLLYAVLAAVAAAALAAGTAIGLLGGMGSLLEELFATRARRGSQIRPRPVV
jgi:hypothetical protein